MTDGNSGSPGADSETILEFRGVTKSFGGRAPAVRDFTLSVARGQLVVLIGPSGCGKTTTLRMVNRLIEPSSGSIWLEGRDCKTYNPVELRRRLGYVIQRIGLMPHLTIGDNITFVLRLLGQPPAARRDRAAELLEMVGLDPAEYLDRYPAELSGGQQQRIGVLRALAHDPDIILMDEPFGALDPLMREQLQEEFKRLLRTVSKTIVFVTHDMDEALSMADIIVLMKDGEIVQVAPPEEMLRHPADEFVASFMGRHRVLRQASEVSVADVMIASPVMTSASNGLARSLELMRRRRVSSLLVQDSQGRYAGVVRQSELQDHIEAGDQSPVGTLADRTVATLAPSDSGLTAMHQLLSHQQVDSLPVLDADDRIVGLVTRGTLVGLLGDALRVARGVQDVNLAESDSALAGEVAR